MLVSPVQEEGWNNTYLASHFLDYHPLGRVVHMSHPASVGEEQRSRNGKALRIERNFTAHVAPFLEWQSSTSFNETSYSEERTDHLSVVDRS